jgi:uncharacterized RDD family membrane protein YckC
MQDISFGTTQNVNLVTEKAGVGKRLIAFFIDYLILLGISILLSVGLASTNIVNSTYIAVIISFIFFTYHFFFELFTDGQSIVKITQKIKVVKSTGESAGFFQFLLRALLRPIDIFFGLGLVIMVFNKNGQRIGDIAANTLVIKIEETLDFKETVIAILEEEYKPLLSRIEVEKLKGSDIELIKKIVGESEASLNYALVGKVYSKVVEITGNKAEGVLPIEYLKAVVKDYTYFN